VGEGLREGVKEEEIGEGLRKGRRREEGGTKR
jgi:hypothetical protein